MTSPDARDPLSLAQKMWAVNGAAVRALRLALVKWERSEDLDQLRAAMRLVADMLEMKDVEGNRMLDVMLAATQHCHRPTAKSLARLKKQLDRLWTP